jgi:hypothetical protein
MVLNTLIYIALVIIVIIVIVVLLRFLFGVLFIVPTSLDDEINTLKDISSQSTQSIGNLINLKQDSVVNYVLAN